jgi:hypothetical protein
LKLTWPGDLSRRSGRANWRFSLEAAAGGKVAVGGVKAENREQKSRHRQVKIPVIFSEGTFSPCLKVVKSLQFLRNSPYQNYATYCKIVKYTPTFHVFS